MQAEAWYKQYVVFSSFFFGLLLRRSTRTPRGGAVRFVLGPCCESTSCWGSPPFESGGWLGMDAGGAPDINVRRVSYPGEPPLGPTTGSLPLAMQ